MREVTARYIACRLHWLFSDVRAIEPEPYTKAHVAYTNVIESLNDIMEAAPEIWEAYQQITQEEAN